MKNPFLKSAIVALLTSTLWAVSHRALAAEGEPLITLQPASQTIFLGDPVTFSVAADGTAPLSFQWLRNGQPIGSATSGAYTILATTLADNGARFSVRVTNPLGNVTSDEAILTIDEGTEVTQTELLVNISSTTWRYNASGANLGTAWKETGYNDGGAGWATGTALFGTETSASYPEPFRTPVSPPGSGGPITTYYRTHFVLPSNVVSATLVASNLVDDGVVYWINGEYAGNLRISSIPPGYTQTAANQDNEAQYEALTLLSANLVPGTNLIAAELHQGSTTSSDAVFGMSLHATITTRVRDLFPPTVVRTVPAANSVVRTLSRFEVLFNEGVSGVDASDLLINNSPATNLSILGPDQYVFIFAPPATGAVQITWSPSHGIRDLSVNENPFAAQNFTVTLDPNAMFSDVRINEFMAANNSGIRDENGDLSDWIEIYNSGSTTFNLGGWYLTDDPFNLTLWRFPAVSILPNQYLLVWASQKNRTNSLAPLHTNFRLERNGEFLALVMPDGTNIASSFMPAYPEQFNDVSYGVDQLLPTEAGYFTTPTPRAANSNIGAGFGPEVQFSRASGTFQNAFSLVLSIPDPNYEIRYHVVNSVATAAAQNVPNTSSPLYSGPIPISGTTQIRARAFPKQAGFFAGPTRTETYIQLSGAAASFTSELPLVIFHNFGGGIPPGNYTDSGAIGVMMVFGTNTPSGRSSLTNEPVVATRAGYHTRGSSTAGFPKRSLAVEAWTEINFDDRNIPLLGMPSESDWVFYAPNQFDRAMLHNPMAYGLGRELGHYASRTRFAEVFLNTGGGAVSYSSPSVGNYNGVYVVEEKIKVDNDRVDIAPLEAHDTNAPGITGGYVLKIDRGGDPDDVGDFNTPNGGLQNSIKFVDPDGLVMTQPQRAAQRQWMINYMSAFESALYGANFRDPVTGYAAYIDTDQWIENHILNTFPFNVDGYRLSGYFYKERDEPGRPGSGKLMQGPLWDFDRSQGTAAPDERPFNPRLWRRQTSGDQGTDLFGNPNYLGVRWWQRLFNDIDFWQKWIDRWQELREGSFTLANLHAMIDRMADQIRDAHARDVQKWGTSGSSSSAPRNGTISVDGYSYTFNGTFQREVEFLKQWYADRVDFIDTNFLERPVFSRGGGPVSSGTQVTITAPTRLPGTTIYYTLDGTDPRLPGGAVAPTALSGTSPITVTVTENTRLVARNFNPNHHNLTGGNPAGNPPLSSSWSGDRAITLVVQTPPLRITELMFHPGQPPPGDTNDVDNFEYVELTNVGPLPISLVGYRFTNGIEYVFTATSAVTSLAPGERVLIVKNSAAFASRYPALTGLVAGEYEGNLANDGERLFLEGPLVEPILDFAYDDDWYRLADGAGFSLVVVDENAPVTAWTNASQWRASAYNGGSPGEPDPAPVAVMPVFVNEVLPNPVPPAVDAIELFNPNPTPVDLSGWFLTDNFDRPTKYRIPDGTIIAGYGFLVFYSTNSFDANPLDPNSFGLGSEGDQVYLFSGDAAGRLTGFYHGFGYGAARQGVSFGRHLDGDGKDHFPAQTVTTLGNTNAAPIVGPVVINEVLYHPPDDGVTNNTLDEFIEVLNTSAGAVPLFDSTAPENTWRLDGGVSFEFPENIILAPGEHIVLVNFNPTNTALATHFRTLYGVDPGVRLFGPYGGALANDTDDVELKFPIFIRDAVAYALMDKVEYSSMPPWPCNASGSGASLQRQDPLAYGNDPLNWGGTTPTAGRLNAIVPPGAPNIIAQPQGRTVAVGANVTFTVTVCGTPPYFYQWRRDGTPVPNADGPVLTITDAQTSDSGVYTVIISNITDAAVSDPAVLDVLEPPTIVAQPQDQVVPGGGTATFTVGVSGTPPFHYQWRFYGTNLPGANDATLVVPNVQIPSGGPYSVYITNLVGNTLSAEAILHPSVPATIVMQPESVIINTGGTNTTTEETAVFTVGAVGQGPIQYQWLLWGTNLPGANSPTLVITNVSLENAGPYTVRVTDTVRSVVSDPAELSVLVRAVIYVAPQSQSVPNGGTITLSVLAGPDHPSLPLTYRWRRGASVIEEGPSPSIILTNVTTTTFYSVLVSNAFGAQASHIPVRITVVADTDGDGLPDTYETALGLNPNLASDAILDLDGDGLSTVEEYIAGTDPTNALSVLKIDLPAGQPAGDDQVHFSFEAQANKTYSVEYSDLLTPGSWQTLVNVHSLPTNRTISVTNTLPPGVTNRFYRTRVPLNQ